jgi:hypothetical protein
MLFFSAETKYSVILDDLAQGRIIYLWSPPVGPTQYVGPVEIEIKRYWQMPPGRLNGRKKRKIIAHEHLRSVLVGGKLQIANLRGFFSVMCNLSPVVRCGTKNRSYWGIKPRVPLGVPPLQDNWEN